MKTSYIFEPKYYFRLVLFYVSFLIVRFCGVIQILIDLDVKKTKSNKQDISE